jgi:hypothetical protein
MSVSGAGGSMKSKCTYDQRSRTCDLKESVWRGVVVCGPAPAAGHDMQVGGWRAGRWQIHVEASGVSLYACSHTRGHDLYNVDKEVVSSRAGTMHPTLHLPQHKHATPPSITTVKAPASPRGTSSQSRGTSSRPGEPAADPGEQAAQ